MPLFTTTKADVAVMIRKLQGRVCCIGDGGNDVSMIQCADVGVGIVGKEGKQASLAADSVINFAICQNCYYGTEETRTSVLPNWDSLLFIVAC